MNSFGNTFSKTLSYLESLEKFGIKPGLEKMRFLLDSIGSPHLKYRSILVAGTNGKGSTATMIAEIARYSGLKTGLYTSPHLVTILERIKIDSANIEERRFAGLVEKLRKKIDLSTPEFHLTLFEFITSLAFLYFYEEKVDLAVFEVGLGGRLDATCVVKPELSVITEIDLDHTEYLGDTVEKITLEKCGIIKENGVALLTSEKKEVVDVVIKNCMEKGAELYRFGRHYKSKRFTSRKDTTLIDFRNTLTRISEIELNIHGHHQILNAATAIQAMHLLTDGAITKQSIKRGLKNLNMEGRIEMVTAFSKRFVLDTAHNPNAAECLLKVLKEEFRYDSLYLIAGIMADKDTESILRILAPIAKTTIVTKPRTKRAASSIAMKTRASGFSASVIETNSVKSAITTAVGIAAPEDLIVITGSCYTVGEAKEYLNPAGKNE